LSFGVRLKVLGEILNAFREDRDLDFGRTRIAALAGIVRDDFLFALGCHRHRQLL
jgi:hypothetical protein